LTQQELASRLGCSVSLIFKIESDERRPSRQVAELLAKHLDIPTEQQELFLKVARQRQATEALSSLAPTASSPISSSLRISSNLPLPLTSLVGREYELRAITQQMQNPACRLLTLTGPGGIGKTRLALEVAHQLREAFEEGVYFVSLVSTSAPEFIIPAIADTLGLSFSGTAELKTQLLNFLKEQQRLLILDNLEHLLNGIELLDEILELAPSIKLLATSREQLNLRAEWVFEIQGFPVPSAIVQAHIESNSAATLFIQRARQVKVNFTPAPLDFPAIARICQLVDGLPLGLELAASWVNTLSCQEIATEIERGLEFLSTSKRDLPERHRSLRAVFDYSWNLLSADEQAVLRNLSVFRGGFQRDAAQQVAGATLPLLASLMGKSLLRRNEAQAGRYSQHELVRQYGAFRLQQDPQNERSARDRHAAYYLSLWRNCEHPLKSSRQQNVLRELLAEIDNFRVAWEWALAQGQFSVLGQCLPTVLMVYDLRGWYSEGIERVELLAKSLTSPSSSEPSYKVVLGLGLALQSWFQFRRGQLNQARAGFERALQILRSHKDLLALTDTLIMFGPVLTSLGQTEQALQAVREGLDTARVSGDPWRVAYALMMQGGILAGSGKYEEAYESTQEALARFRRLEDTRLIVVTLNTLGFACMQLSRYAEAREVLQESLRRITPVEDPWSVGTAYGNLGIVELAQGNTTEAQAFLEKSISLFTDLGLKGDIALYLTYLGEACAAAGAVHEAEQHWQDGIRIASEAHALPTLLGILIRLASLYADRGDILRAYEWATQVANHPASWQETKSRAEQLRATLHERLSARELETVEHSAPGNFPADVIQKMFDRQ
jgi:predicted ATPase/transcriptional regulator with XRE-family HTH domain/Tfp pilus assembly protein PilF